MMKIYDKSVKTNQNPNLSYILDQRYKISIIGSPGSGKFNVLLNIMKHERPDIDKIYLYAKDQSIDCLLMKDKK